MKEKGCWKQDERELSWLYERRVAVTVFEWMRELETSSGRRVADQTVGLSGPRNSPPESGGTPVELRRVEGDFAEGLLIHRTRGDRSVVYRSGSLLRCAAKTRFKRARHIQNSSNIKVQMKYNSH